MKSLIKEGLFWSIAKTNVHRLLDPLLGGVGVILMLHRVLPHVQRSRFASNRNIEIDTHTLERLLDLFQKADFDFVGLGECRARILGKKAERRCVVITFDDGYLDNYEHAYPILAERRIPFAVYLASKFPERQMPTWWYALEDLVLAKDEISFCHEGIDHTFP